MATTILETDFENAALGDVFDNSNNAAIDAGALVCQADDQDGAWAHLGFSPVDNVTAAFKITLVDLPLEAVDLFSLIAGGSPIRFGFDGSQFGVGFDTDYSELTGGSPNAGEQHAISLTVDTSTATWKVSLSIDEEDIGEYDYEPPSTWGEVTMTDLYFGHVTDAQVAINVSYDDVLVTTPADAPVEEGIYITYPEELATGEGIGVTGHGFRAEEKVSITFAMPEQTDEATFYTVADSEGNWSIDDVGSFIPKHSGIWKVVAQGEQTGRYTGECKVST